MKADVKGIGINYELSGKQREPTLMLSHPLGSNLGIWEPQISAFREHFRVLRYDTRGHGGSDVPGEPYTLDELGQDAVGLLDYLGLGAVHWIGLSMGGMIGLWLAINQPDRLLSLALCDTTAVIAQEAQRTWQERIDTAYTKGMRALVDSTLEGWLTPSSLSQNSLQTKYIRKQFEATPVTGYVGCSKAIRELDLWDQLVNIKIPTLVIVGEDDPRTPVSASRGMQERIPDADMVILPNAFHLSNVEQHRAFNYALTGFVKLQSSTS